MNNVRILAGISLNLRRTFDILVTPGGTCEVRTHQLVHEGSILHGSARCPIGHVVDPFHVEQQVTDTCAALGTCQDLRRSWFPENNSSLSQLNVKKEQFFERSMDKFYVT